MKFPRIPLKVVLFALPILVKRIRWRASRPGPADITPGYTPKTPEPVASPPAFSAEDPMKFNLTALLALIAGIASLLVSPEIAPMLPEVWTKLASAIALALAAFAPKAFDTQ
jgi:hypothetical protein